MNSFISEIYKYRFLIHELVIRDIKKKYRRSVLGIFMECFKSITYDGCYSYGFSTILDFLLLIIHCICL